MQGEPHEFSPWIRLTHFVNFFFLMLLARSGLSILVDHPRLYSNRNCTPKTDWIKFTPIAVPLDRVWTSKDDARYISSLFALPGYRHTIGMARSWHFFERLCFFLLNGFVFVLHKPMETTRSGLVGYHSGCLEDICDYVTLHLPRKTKHKSRLDAATHS